MRQDNQGYSEGEEQEEDVETGTTKVQRNRRSKRRQDGTLQSQGVGVRVREDNSEM